MFLARLFKHDPERDSAQLLYVAVVAQARQRAFYSDMGVPDSLDGRFEMIALHVALVERRLRALSSPLARALCEALFADMDRSLREMGAGDMGVGKRVLAMAQGFYGRAAAYDAALGDAVLLAATLRRNVYGTLPDPLDPQALAGYVERCAAALADHPLERFERATIDWPATI